MSTDRRPALMDSVHGLYGLGLYPFEADLIQSVETRSGGWEKGERRRPLEFAGNGGARRRSRRSIAGTAFPVAKSPTLWLYRERRRRGIHLRRRRGSAMAGRCRSAEREGVRGGSPWRERSGGRNGSAVGWPALPIHGEAREGLGRREGVGKREIDGGFLPERGGTSRRRRMAARFGRCARLRL